MSQQSDKCFSHWTDDLPRDGVTRTDSDEITTRTVTVYDAEGPNDPSLRQRVATTTEFVKLPFSLIIPEFACDGIGCPGAIGPTTLPPSFCDRNVQKEQYM